MRVGDASLTPGRDPIPANQKPQRPANAASTAATARQETAETTDLVARLRAIPELRAEVVADIERRLSSGELLTRQAAEATAASLLSDLSNFFTVDSETEA